MDARSASIIRSSVITEAPPILGHHTYRKHHRRHGGVSVDPPYKFCCIKLTKQNLFNKTWFVEQILFNKPGFVEQNLFVYSDLEEFRTKSVQQNRRGGVRTKYFNICSTFCNLLNKICSTNAQCALLNKPLRGGFHLFNILQSVEQTRCVQQNNIC